MQESFSGFARRVASTAALCVAFVAGPGCGDDGNGGGGLENACGLADPDCLGCAALGACCLVSDNCPVATICNLPSEPLFDPNAPEGTCLKVTCDRNEDCDAPKVCSLEKICKTPVCQIDADCTGGDVCISGECMPRPSAASARTCEVTSKDTVLTEGARIRLVAVARGEDGRVLPAIPLEWTSSDPSVVSVNGQVATGGVTPGSARLTAAISGGGPACAGAVDIGNVPPSAGADARVVVVTDGLGTPLTGATVELDAGGRQSATTDADGIATFSGLGGPIAAVTVMAPGYQFLTVVQPGTSDLYIPLPRQPDTSRAGGFRGLIDISQTARGDIQLGFAGPAIPSNLLDFGLDSLLGDLIPTEIDAPELGLELTGMDAVDLPGGLLAAIGNRRYTSDGDGPRCQGTTVRAGQLGCFVARAPEGSTAGWALAGQLELKDVAPLATLLSDALGEDGPQELPIADIFIGVLPLLRNLNHAIAASIAVTSAPKIGDQADYTQYQRQDLIAGQPLGVLSVVDVPDLPGAPSECANAAIIVAAANLEGRGLVPLGITAGLDTLNANETADCRVNGIAQAFGPGSAGTADGQMALSMAPLHSGAEGSDTLLLLVAADIDRLLSDEGFQAAAIVERTPNGVAPSQTITGRYLDLPTGTVNGAAGTISLGSAVSGATVNRYELQGGGQTWLVYAPSSLTDVSLPAVTGPDGVSMNLTDAYLLSMGINGEFSEVFELGSGKTLDRLFDTITGFSVQQCASTAAAPCRLQ